MFSFFRTTRQRVITGIAVVAATLVGVFGGCVGYREAKKDYQPGGHSNSADRYVDSSGGATVGRGCTTLDKSGQERLLPGLTPIALLEEMERRKINPDFLPVDDYMREPSGNARWQDHDDFRNGEGIAVHGIGRVHRSMVTPQGLH